MTSPSSYQVTASPGTLVIHHSKHHTKSKPSSSSRQRRHSHSGGQLPAARPSPAPHVAAYQPSTSYPKPAVVHHATSSQNLGSSYHRPSQSYSQAPAAYQKPSSSKSSHGHSSSARPQFVHYSKCTGRRKALCVSHPNRCREEQRGDLHAAFSGLGF